MLKRYVRQISILCAGLLVSTVGIVFMHRANIGLEPWSCLQRGLELATGVSFGFASVIVGAIAIAIAVVFGEHIGLGTLGNVFLCGAFIDGLLALNIIPEMQTMAGGIVMLLFGMEFLALGTWLYMSACLGVGPRDALMVALAKKTGRSVGACRSTLELLCILAGWMMGAKVGVGTVITAVGVGALFNLNFKLLHFDAAYLKHENVADTLKHWFHKA